MCFIDKRITIGKQKKKLALERSVKKFTNKQKETVGVALCSSRWLLETSGTQNGWQAMMKAMVILQNFI